MTVYLTRQELEAALEEVVNELENDNDGTCNLCITNRNTDSKREYF